MRNILAPHSADKAKAASDPFELSEKRVKEIDNDNLEYCVHKLGIDHILFSADFPYLGVENTRAFFDNAPLTEKDKELIAYRNAEKLFHI